MSNYVPLSYLPGVCKVNSAYASSIQAAINQGRESVGRFTDMDGARFVAGLPEKLGGNEALTDDTVEGVTRGLRDWRDNGQVVYLGIGTHKKLYYFSQNDLVDITPLRPIVASTLTNALSTTSGSKIVSVNHTAHGLQVADYFIMTADAAIGGLAIGGVYFVNTVTDTDNYTFLAADEATGTVSGGGGNISYSYYRKTLTNPFATVNGSSIVTVTHSGHNAAAGDFVTYSGASAIGGLTINGEYEIINVDSSTYTIDAGSAASSTATGGGSVSTQYDISIGMQDSATALGYGVGGYGESGYGETADLGSSTFILLARVWCLAKYGQQLLANPSGGTIYIWDPTIRGRAYPMYGAPAEVLGMFVTPERFVVALGTDGLGMRLQWPDQQDYTDWISTDANTANEGRTLQEGAFLVNGIAVRDDVNLVFSNTAAYLMAYSGDDFIYNTSVAGTKCGLIGPLACCTAGGVVYWMSDKEFWNWNGSVLALPSDDIRDYVFKDFNGEQSVKCVAGSNIAKKEIWYFYCSAASTEIDRYVIFHIDQNCWSSGFMERTSWIDKELFTYVIAADSTGALFNHEIGYDDNGLAMDSYIEFSPMDIAKGGFNQDIFSFVPDFKRQIGDVTFSPLAKSYPQETNTVYGPYAIADDGSNPIIGIRIGAKMFGYKIESNVLGGDWRLGLPRVEIQQAGARR